MPKIIIGVSSSFCANFLKGQVGFLGRKGWEVILISGPGEEIEQLSKDENARLYPIRFIRSRFSLSDLKAIQEIMQIIRQEKPDLVNAGNPKSGLLIMIACWLLGFKNRMFTLHGLVADSRTGFAKFVIRMSEKLTCRLAKKIYVVSPSLCRHAVEQKILPAAKTVVVRKGSCNGVNTDLYARNKKSLDEAKEMQEKWQLPENEFRIGFVGRLSKDKGLDVLFEAFNILKTRYGNIRLLLAGPLEKQDPFSQEYYHQLHNDDKVTYLGKILHIVPVYVLINILVLSSFREGFGNVLIEGASMELPVIAPDIPGCRDALREDYNGFFFSKGDVNQLVEAIEKYLQNPELCLRHGANGRKFVKENFVQETIWEGQLDLYHSFVS